MAVIHAVGGKLAHVQVPVVDPKAVIGILPIALADIAGSLARQCRKGVVDLLKLAKHGPGRNVFLIEFYYKK